MADINKIKAAIENGETSLGIELGSTRIKAVLIDKTHNAIATGSHEWENKLVDGNWTYALDDVWKGIQDSYAQLKSEVKSRYGVILRKIGSVGISAMMHGYLVFDTDDKLLVPFRTWRNTTTEEAAEKLKQLLGFNIPQRWSVAHIYQAILNKEPHVKDISYITTLAGYVHQKLTDKKAVGVGEASGMFPIDSKTGSYNLSMLAAFDNVAVNLGFNKKLADILPAVLSAGENAGTLSNEGALLLDLTGDLSGGCLMCPPEGDAGTGMVATNSIASETGNVSAGTSIFAMIVLKNELSKVYTEIDMVTTPDGKPVAMVHCNNCTSDLDAWVKLFAETIDMAGFKIEKWRLYDLLYAEALKGEADCGGILTYNYYSGEPITGLTEGRPLAVRTPNAKLSTGNFMRSLLYSAMATLKLGMNILTENEKVNIRQMMGHGGLFKTKDVGQRLMAGALNVPVSVMESAGEGGAWGIALLAQYALVKAADETLDTFLEKQVFANVKGTRTEPISEDIKGFNTYMDRYLKGLEIERSAVERI